MNIDKLGKQDLTLSLWQVRDYVKSLINETAGMQYGETTIADATKHIEWLEGSEIESLSNLLADLGLEVLQLQDETAKRQKELQAWSVPEESEHIASDYPSGYGYDS